MEKITKLLIGSTGIGGIEATEYAMSSGDNATEIIKLIIQVAVGLATIWSILRKK